MEKSGKPESSWDGDEDPKPLLPPPIYQCSPSNLYCSGQKGLSSSGEEYCSWADMIVMNNEHGSSSSFDQGGPEVDPTRFAETSSVLQPDHRRNARNARKRENDRNYRERTKNKDKETKSKLCGLDNENRELMLENESLKHQLVSVNQSLQSQATDLQQLRNETELWNLEHAKQTALVQTLSDQLVASAAAREDHQTLLEQNRRLRQSITAGDDHDHHTLLKLAEDTANLKLENGLLKLNNDALTAKMVHHPK